MTTSGVTAFSMTARDMVKAALQEGRILALGDECEAIEEASCILRFNAMMKSWAMEGVDLWRNATAAVAVTAGAASTALPSNVREVTDARIVENASYERQLGKWTRADYRSIPNKVARGNPVAFYSDRQIAGTVLYLYPVPLSNVTLNIDYDRAFETITDPAQTVDIPEEAQETVFLNLAQRCAGLFGAELSPELVSRAGYLFGILKDNSRPDSYFMGPYGGRSYA